jgi:hypothetical protein
MCPLRGTVVTGAAADQWHSTGPQALVLNKSGTGSKAAATWHFWPESLRDVASRGCSGDHALLLLGLYVSSWLCVPPCGVRPLLIGQATATMRSTATATAAVTTSLLLWLLLQASAQHCCCCCCRHFAHITAAVAAAAATAAAL